MGQRVGNVKTCWGGKEQMMRLAKKGELPPRIKLLAYYMVQERTILMSDCPKLLEVDRAKEAQLLWKRLQRDEYQLVRSLYKQFLRRLRDPVVIKGLPKYGTEACDMQMAEALSSIPVTAPGRRGTFATKASRKLRDPRRVSSRSKVIAKRKRGAAAIGGG